MVRNAVLYRACLLYTSIASPALREQLGERGREMILRDKDWKVLARKYQGVYEFVSSNRGDAAKLVPQSAVGS